MVLPAFTSHRQGKCGVRFFGNVCITSVILVFLTMLNTLVIFLAPRARENKSIAMENHELDDSHIISHLTGYTKTREEEVFLQSRERYSSTINSVHDGYDPRLYTYRVVKKFPHDPHAFTQGLLFHSSDTLYESTGAVGGPSTVREVSLTTGEVRKQTQVPSKFFAEGLTLLGDKLLMTTWRTNRGFYYDATSLQPVGEFNTPLSDGWGIATFEDSLVISDATTELHFVDVGKSLEETTLNRSITIKDGGRPIRFANELETVEGEIWANILERDCVARIDPFTGDVNGWIDLSGLSEKLDSSPKRPGVLNGIAYDRQGDRIFFTGKNWPNLFELRITPHKTKTLEDVRSICHPALSLPHYGYP